MEHGNNKLEVMLEVKSLRRIISAYLNYSEAAEVDVRRYERSFARLSPPHKALIPNFPLKCQKLRRCISINSFFIMNMLQLFEPPFDMSQDVEICKSECLESAAGDHWSPEREGNSEDRNLECCGQHASTSGRNSSSNDEAHRSPKRRIDNEEMPMESFCESVMGSWSVSCRNNVKHDHARVDAMSTANGKVNSPPHDWLDPSLQLNVPLVDVDKVRCIIRNIVRDWAPEGQRERDQCYKPILEELDRLFPVRCKTRPPCCLVPGAGLGRLALEISCLGFISQGNEFSYYMMICSSFILNHTQSAREWTIYPWIHSNCNSLSDKDQLRPVQFPDLHPASAGITEGFSMCGGDFVEVYNDASQEGSWDAVVTCFFLDTAHNIIEYIEIISKILKDEGVWINLGPLLYHFADSYGPDEEMSIELSLEDVKRIAFHYGFEMQMEKTIETTYTTNPRSMMQNRYFAAFWMMKKKRPSDLSPYVEKPSVA